MKKYPKRLYVKRENEGSEDEYLSAKSKIDDLCINNESAKVGIYVLEKTATAVNETVFKTPREVF